jgi:hypothetical protein
MGEGERESQAQGERGVSSTFVLFEACHSSGQRGVHSMCALGRQLVVVGERAVNTTAPHQQQKRGSLRCLCLVTNSYITLPCHHTCRTAEAVGVGKVWGTRDKHQGVVSHSRVFEATASARLLTLYQLPHVCCCSCRPCRTAEVVGEGKTGGTRDERLGDVGLVVLDEVHYLGDPWRGSVWEEAIINCPKHIQVRVSTQCSCACFLPGGVSLCALMRCVWGGPGVTGRLSCSCVLAPPHGSAPAFASAMLWPMLLPLHVLFC